MVDPSNSKQPSYPHLWEVTWIRDLALLGVVLLLVAVVCWLRAIFQPLLLALLFAYLFNPIVAWVERRSKWSRLAVVIALSSLVAVGLITLVLTVVPLIIAQTIELVQNLPQYADRVAQEVGVRDGAVLRQIQEKSAAFLEEPVTNLSRLWQGVTAGFGVVTGVVGSVTSFAVGLALFPVYFFFFSWKLPNIFEALDAFIPTSRRAGVHDVLKQMDAAVGGYFRTRLVIALIMGILYAIGWGLVGVPYWLLLGLLGGFLGIVPYFPMLAWLAAMLLQFLKLQHGLGGMEDVMTVFFWPTLVYALVQASDDWFLTPWMQGQELDMSFVTIILAVLIGGATAGLLGMLLAVPVAACLTIFWAQVARPRLVAYAQAH